MEADMAKATGATPIDDAEALARMNAQGGQDASVVPFGNEQFGLGDYHAADGVQHNILLRLSLTHGVGTLSAKFNPGSFVLAKEELLAERGKRLTVIVARADEYWKEYLSDEQFKAGLRPQRYDTELAAVKAGHQTRWSKDPEGPKPTCSPAVDIRLFIQQPENLLSPNFILPLGDKLYTMAIFTADKTAYRAINPTLFMRKAAKRPLHTAFCELYSDVMPLKNGRLPVVPKLVYGRDLDPATLGSINQVIEYLQNAKIQEPEGSVDTDA